MALSLEVKSNIEAQIARQTMEREAFTPALEEYSTVLASKQAEVDPLQSELDANKARQAELEALIAEKMPAVSDATNNLRLVQASAKQLEDSIQGCQLILDADSSQVLEDAPK
jgi:chromosome segregation ATPase